MSQIINGPDGPVSFPDNMSEAEINNAMDEAYPAPAPSKPYATNQPDTAAGEIGAVHKGAVNALTFGHGPQLQGAMQNAFEGIHNALSSNQLPSTDNTAQAQSEYDQSQAQYPKGNLAGAAIGTGLQLGAVGVGAARVGSAVKAANPQPIAEYSQEAPSMIDSFIKEAQPTVKKGWDIVKSGVGNPIPYAVGSGLGISGYEGLKKIIGFKDGGEVKQDPQQSLAFASIANAIALAEQANTPKEATDYSLAQTSATYRQLKTKPDKGQASPGEF